MNGKHTVSDTSIKPYQPNTIVLSYFVPGGDLNISQYNLQTDLRLSDVQFGIVTGTAFVFTSGIAGLVFGHLADIYPRKWMWITTCLLMTLCTFAESFAVSFATVLPARIGFAIFRGSKPVSLSLLSDFNVPRDRGMAQAIFAAGMYLGVGMSSISLLLDKTYG